MPFSVVNYGEAALLINFKAEISVQMHQQVRAFYHQLKQMNLLGVQSILPAYHSITIVFDPFITKQETLKLLIKDVKIDEKQPAPHRKNIIEIPVCYQEPFALDMSLVCQHSGLTRQEIIDLHSETPYLVYMLGFAPGFMYLGGLDERLQIPRKLTPRLQIPAGAVGLADKQTGVYPLVTPGGWQIIGQTPLTLFSDTQPALVAMGDYVKFTPISVSEFENMRTR
ncbi:MAG: 5-oxoprolinase subunit PxpB [Wenyingzhuangia sp.]|uniref:5-oxoprolinase subunit PxpB n=1 Tax=Wenyingzhuangia sp. TaxID=1964193 RepID=UPI00321AFE85